MVGMALWLFLMGVCGVLGYFIGFFSSIIAGFLVSFICVVLQILIEKYARNEDTKFFLIMPFNITFIILMWVGIAMAYCQRIAGGN